MHASSIPGRAPVRKPYAESPTPCLLFEAARDAQGNLLAFRCSAANLAAEACAPKNGPLGGLKRWSAELEERLELAACSRVVATGEPYTSEVRFGHEGAESWWLATAVRHGDGFALWLRDVTHERLEEHRLREALEQARLREERMEEEAELRERFIGVPGHDLRNPLNAISLSAQAMAHYGSLSQMQRELGQRIEASAARMKKMISDILDLTRARRSGGIPLCLTPTNLPRVCRQVVEELVMAYPGRLVSYEHEGSGDGVWDAERLAQVVSNLVGNALEHGRERVPVSMRSYPRGEWMVLEVHNAGTPIPEHRLATLFEPFQPTCASGENKRRKGLGLGLYIVRELVHAHGGCVAVRSVQEDGTTFTVLLPLDSGLASAERSPQDELPLVEAS